MFRIGLMACFSWICCSCKEESTPRDVEKQAPFSIYGPKSRIEEKQILLITDEKKWAEVWHKHSNGNDEPPKNLDVTNVDFSQYDVVGVFVGKERAYGVAPCNVVEEADKVRLRCEVLSYSTGVDHPGGTPWGVFALKKSKKTIVLEFGLRTERNGAINKWVQVKTLSR